jgi:hypothetical protein
MAVFNKLNEGSAAREGTRELDLRDFIGGL